MTGDFVDKTERVETITDAADEGWRHKDLWSVRGRSFMVEISRHTETPSSFDPYEGPNRWCVYAYIYPEHPHFAAFEGHDMWQPAATEMPLHGGPSYLSRHVDDRTGKVTSYQVGADYHHLHDDHFTHYATPDHARFVFEDAKSLFDWLQACTMPEPATAASETPNEGTAK